MEKQLQDRKKELIVEVVRDYIKKAEPIGSKHLEKKLGVSSATIRNEMLDLEHEGFLDQPHTSAGRVPTVKAYEFYINNYLTPKDLSSHEKKTLESLHKLNPVEDIFWKEVAKRLADFSGHAVVVGFNKNDLYYTGLSNLFAQPEFNHLDMVHSMSHVIDKLDDVMSILYKELPQEVQIKIGDNNPFGNMCSTVITSYTLPAKKVLGFLGPWRMDYDLNVGLLNYVRQIIK